MKNAKQVNMLEECLNIIEATGKNPQEAYHDLLHYVAYLVEIEEVATPFMNKEAHEKLLSTLDIRLLKMDQWDWFGEVYEKRGIAKPETGQFFTPKSVSDALAKKNQIIMDPNAVQSMFDPVIGSGRLILSMNSLVPTGVFYYGAELDLIAYRTALINMKLYSIPSRLLYGNGLTIDVSADSPAWQESNRWEPLSEKKLKRAANLGETKALASRNF